MKTAFISYSRKNKAFVHALATAFEQHQHDIWVDWEGIPHGADWWHEIELGIEASHSFVFVISPDSIASEVCMKELKHAVDNNKRLVPLLYQEVSGKIPPELACLNWVFFRDDIEDFKQAFQNLLVTLDTDLDFVKHHTRLLTRAKEWQEHQFDNSFLLRGSDLSNAEQWLASCNKNQQIQPTQLHTRYIIASGQFHAKKQRQRFVFTGIMLLLSFGLLLFAHYQKNVAKKAQSVAETERQHAQTAHKIALKNEVTALNALSRANLIADNQLNALLTGIKAGKKLSLLSDKQQHTQLQQSVTANLLEVINNTSEINHFEWHTKKVRDIEFSPDGQYLVSGGSDTDLAVWQLDGKKIYERQHNESITSVSISADSRYVVSGGRAGYMKLWSLADGTLKSTFEHEAQIYSVDFSPDQKTVAMSDENNAIHIFDVIDEKLVLNKRFIAHDNSVQAVQFSLDGKILASASADRLIKLWSTTDYQLLHTLAGHTDRVYALDFDPQGKWLVSASADNSVRFWDLSADVPTLRPIALPHNNWVFDVKFNPTGDRLASATGNGDVMLWSRDSTLLKKSINPKTRMMQVAFSPDNNMLASANSDKRIRLYKVHSNSRVKILTGHTSGLKDVDFSASGQLLATTGSDETIRLWQRTEAGYHLKTTVNTHVSIRDVDFIPHSEELLAIGYDNNLRRISPDGEIKEILHQNSQQSKSISISPDAKTIATAFDKDIQLWTMDGLKKTKINAHARTINSVIFSHNGQYIASGSADTHVKLWDTAGNLLHDFDAHQDWINNLSFSPDDRYLASASSDNTIKLWDTQTGELLNTLEGHQDWVWDVSFSPNPDIKLLVSGSSDNSVRVWSYPEGELKHTLTQHDSWVRAVGFSPDGQEIASASADKKVIVWSLKAMHNHTANNTSLDRLLSEGCALLKDYLATNINISEHDSQLCD